MDGERLDTPIRTAISIAVNLLVSGEYGVLESLTGGRFLSAEQIAGAIHEYGRTLVAPPTSAWTSIDAVEAPDTEQATFHVVFPLWTEEEGMSDLALELRLIEAYPDALETEVVDLHVL